MNWIVKHFETQELLDSFIVLIDGDLEWYELNPNEEFSDKKRYGIVFRERILNLDSIRAAIKWELGRQNTNNY